MINVPVDEAKARLFDLLLAQQGQDITITRHGVAAARLVAPLPGPDGGADPAAAQRQSVHTTLEALSVLRRGVSLDMPVRQAIDAGRD
jgi:antitoxin (DNA-binding transcriptional repressor) of toxin-antitoxin stability system